MNRCVASHVFVSRVIVSQIAGERESPNGDSRGTAISGREGVMIGQVGRYASAHNFDRLTLRISQEGSNTITHCKINSWPGVCSL
jgi:hypothetical protein